MLFQEYKLNIALQANCQPKYRNLKQVCTCSPGASPFKNSFVCRAEKILSKISLYSNEMVCNTQIKVVSIIYRALLNCHLNYEGKALTKCWKIFDKNLANSRIPEKLQF